MSFFFCSIYICFPDTYLTFLCFYLKKIGLFIYHLSMRNFLFLIYAWTYIPATGIYWISVSTLFGSLTWQWSKLNYFCGTPWQSPFFPLLHIGLIFNKLLRKTLASGLSGLNVRGLECIPPGEVTPVEYDGVDAPGAVQRGGPASGIWGTLF